MTKPLRALTAKDVKLKWTRECQDTFKELKGLLMADMVMANFDTERETRLYMDGRGASGSGGDSRTEI